MRVDAHALCRRRRCRARQHLLCGFFNSFVVNYLVRLRVTTHVTIGTVAVADPIPKPRRRRAEIAALARLLARRRTSALARLNVLVARLYQLSADEFRHILDTFPLIPASERQETLRMFVAETQRDGRTQR